MKKNILLLLLIVFVSFGCKGKKPQEENLSDSAKETEKIQEVPIEAHVVSLGDISLELPLTGIVEPIHQVDIAAEVSGKITKINKNIGDQVTPRDTLAYIDDVVPESQFLQAQSQLLSAEANLKIANLNLQSDSILYENKDISELAWQNSIQSAKGAEANYLAAQANFKAMKKQFEDTRIQTPFAGLVTRKNIDLGQMISPGMIIYRVADLSELKIDVAIPQSVIHQVSAQSKARVICNGKEKKEYIGELKYLSPQADERTGSFLGEIHFKNPCNDMVKAGITVTSYVSLNEFEDLILVPSDVIVQKKDKDYIYKIIDNQAVLTEVNIKETINGKSVIENGLSTGDTIVTVGMKNLGVNTPVFIESIK